MADVPLPSPEDSVASSDPGDETANRYRYQWTWSAVVCCTLLDETRDVQEVFCEHHEDVLLKHEDGSFTGHQVKTRSQDQPVWKAKDNSVLGSCARFARLEADYPGQLRGFHFLTNHPLHNARNGQDLNYILNTISDATTFASLPSNVASWVKRVAKDAGVTEAIALAAMSKTVASANLPKLHDATMRLIDAIVQCWAPAAECSHESVRQAAQALIEECGRASSLDHEQLLPVYVLATMGQDEDVAARIDGKRMTIARVHSVLEQGRDSLAMLEGDPASYVSPTEGSTDLLQQKLDVGGFSAVSRNSAEDLRDKAEYLGLKWTKQFGNSKGLARYSHVRSFVLSDAGRAFDTTQTEADGFGPAMREELRRRFRDRRMSGDQLFDSTDDHLEGVAFSLTGECQIVWSHARPWEAE